MKLSHIDPPACEEHPDRRVAPAGSAMRSSGRVKRWRCTDPDDPALTHLFVVSAKRRSVTPMGVVVTCPEHPEAKVHRHARVLVAGLERIRFKCSTGHTFSLPVDLLPGESPRFASQHASRLSISRRSPFTPEQVADALVAMGRGGTYREVSAAASGRPDESSRSWRLAADWVDAYAPVLAEQHLPHTWPANVMVGFAPLPASQGTWGLLVAAERTGDQEGRLVVARLVEGETEDAWADLFASLSGAPSAVTGPAGSPARAGLRRVAGARSLWLSSHWHLRRDIRRAARDSGVSPQQAATLAEQALASLSGWRTTVVEVEHEYSGSPLAEMLSAASPDVTKQLAALPGAPRALRSSAPIQLLSEPIIVTLTRRKGSMSNLARTQNLVNLMVLAQRGQDDRDAYARDLAEVARTGVTTSALKDATAARP